MPDYRVNNKRIAKNTLALYLRIILSLIIQLYTVPIVLKMLGASDYGLYSVIGSILAMVSIVGYFASGSQRFFSYALGLNDIEKLKKLFATTQTIYFVLASLVFLFLEVVGVWFIENKMQIPEGRLTVAHWVFQFSVITFLVNLLSAPYNALIIAHERMDLFAYVGIGSSVLKLVAVILLQFVSYDKLIFYALSILIVQLLERFVYQVYCRTHYEECRGWKFAFDRKNGKEIMTYSGFNAIGGIAVTLKNQGLSVVMNVFFGTLFNAAHGIAMHLQGVMEQVVMNLFNASRPQVIKSYANRKYDEMWKLVFRTTMMAYYLIMVMAVVLLFEMPTILGFWLHDVPAYTVHIARTFIICLMIQTNTKQLISVFQAMNKIKYYQVSSSLILLLYVPFTYLILKVDATNALVPYYIQIVFTVLYVTSIIIVSVRISHLNIRYYMIRVIAREGMITMAVLSFVYFVVGMMEPTLYRVVVTIVVTVGLSIVLIGIGGFEKDDLRMMKRTLGEKFLHKK